MTLDRDHGLELLRMMVRMRRLEEKSAELYSATKIRGFLHLYNGQEAVATGVVGSLTPDDAVVATYREHAHALARGISARAIMAEMLGKQEGTSRGRGGSMHLFDRDTRFFGGNAIVGGGLPLATGLALADRMRGVDNVTCCFFGEGAVAEGEFHESMNLAALWGLPVLFACENNQYAMGTALVRSESVVALSAKAEGYDVESQSVDGMDVLDVEAAANNAIEYVRHQQRPFFLELRTYRFRAHSMFDAELYRSKEEVERWRERDPIPHLVDLMKERELLSEADLESIEAAVADEIEDAVAFAENGKLEPVEDLTRFVYSERDEP